MAKANEAIRSTVTHLERIYGIVIALSINQVFMQFFAPSYPGVCGIQWDRLWSLVSILLPVIPFFHGMGRYLDEMYVRNQPDKCYGYWLLLDCIAFTVEAAFFFALTRYLPPDRWAQFAVAILLLLFCDVLWGAFVWKFRTPLISSWVIVNLCAIPLLALILACFHRTPSWWPVSLVFGVVLARTIADYSTGWGFYFPRSPSRANQRDKRNASVG
ncbi:MAG TPA: hypothetical protein PLU87_14600 [Sedimentisphaerales bacterium]|nr:hypothetical protein [Sedimentisphaerales bacterium]HRS12940.1 hypothetical protein [Sedimentisphaerales bacterium]HRV49563.1 hypothetical protein [Sedimentisphaerales bacterium]